MSASHTFSIGSISWQVDGGAADHARSSVMVSDSLVYLFLKSVRCSVTVLW